MFYFNYWITTSQTSGNKSKTNFWPSNPPTFSLYFVGGHVKDRLYCSKLTLLQHWNESTLYATATIIKDTLEHIWQQLKCKFDLHQSANKFCSKKICPK